MTLRVRLVLALLIAAVAGALVPAAASARVLTGTVIAPAAKDAKGQTRLPILASKRAELVTRRVVLTPIVPKGDKPVRWASDRLTLNELRPGDVVSVDLRGSRARTLELERSGKADDFSRILKQLYSLDQVVKRTIEVTTPIAGQPVGAMYPRDQLTEARRQVIELQSALSGIDADVETSLQRLAEVRPAEERRKAAVVAAQAHYEGQLNAIRQAAAASYQKAELAAEGLDAVANVPGSNDGTQVPVDPTLPIALPFGSISTVSDLLATVVTLADTLGIAEPPLIG